MECNDPQRRNTKHSERNLPQGHYDHGLTGIETGPTLQEAGDYPPEPWHGHLTKTNPSYSSSSYRVVNTLHLGYRNQSVNAV
jgi:hypothetical protein